MKVSMWIVWTEKDGGKLFHNKDEAERFAFSTGGRLEEVTEITPDRWWITR